MKGNKLLNACINFAVYCQQILLSMLIKIADAPKHTLSYVKEHTQDAFTAVAQLFLQGVQNDAIISRSQF